MEQNKVTINELAVNFVAELRRIGYSERTIYQTIYRSVRHVVKYFETAGVTFYSLETALEMLVQYKERRELGEISDTYFRQIRSAINRMNEFFITGSLQINSNKHGTIYKISSENENLIDRFIVWKDYGTNTKDDVRWVVRKYLFYMEQQGHMTKMVNIPVSLG
ncbi:MAG: hypothetical protein GX567_08415 [Clostridia bacterium]|nr:hypothetical protein [Clostridia bacterium]